MTTKYKNITSKQYSAFEKAYEFYNKNLFDGKLPYCIITYNRHNKAYGFFCDSRFASTKTEEDRADEIALNPDFFDRTEKEILCTLVHEMGHLWQARFGKPSRSGYHNKEWGNKMLSVGLQPYDASTGEEAISGAKISTKAIPGGIFDKITDDLLKNNVVSWKSLKMVKKSSKNKIKYTCPTCNTNIWGKPGLNIECTDCGEMFEEIEN